MQYIEEAGDVVGYEIKIVFTGTSFQGAMQIAEGVPGPLIVVEVEAEGEQIRFSIPDSSTYAGEFTGTVEKGFLKGELRFKSGATEKLKLPRTKSYWD